MSEEKIQLLVITDLFPRNEKDMRGIFIKDYLTSLAPHCDIDLVYVDMRGEKQGLVKEQMAENITTHSYFFAEEPAGGFKKIFQWKKRMRKANELCENLKEGKQVIHAHGSIFSGTVAMRLAKKWNVPFVVTEHTGPFSVIADSFLKKRAAKKVMQAADAVLTVSGNLKHSIEEAGIKPKQTIVTYNPVDTELFTQKTDKKEYKNFLYAGRLDGFKGAFRALRAFHKVAENFPDWTYTIIGQGEDLEKIAGYVAKHEADIGERVIMKGQCTKQEMAEAMNESSFFILPSEHESFGLVVAEAMACGRPVIIGKGMASVEFVTEQCGMRVNVKNNNEIAAALVMMMKEFSGYSSKAIRMHIESNFGFKVFGEKLSGIYKGLI